MARISFRQGIVSHQTDTSGTPNFLTVNGAYVNIYVSPDPTIIAFIHGDTDYLYTESVSVQQAWGPLTVQTAWLYWDLDMLTGRVTRGFTTLEPKETNLEPQSPATGQMWFNPTTRKWKQRVGSGWREVVRVFAARIENSTTLRSMSINGPSSFRGTQVGITTPTRAGAVVYTDTGHAVRANGRLFTTEDQFLTGVPTGASLRVANIIISGKAQTPLAAYQVVQYNGFDTVGTASPLTQGHRLFGIIEEDAVADEVINFITEGLIYNYDWDWVAAGAQANTPLYINMVGQIVLNPAYPNNRPVGLVTGRHEILFAPQMYADITNLGATPAQVELITQNVAAIATKVTTVNAGDRITVDNSDPLNPVVHADEDPQTAINTQAIEEKGQVDRVVAGDRITVDNTDPKNPIVHADEQIDPQVALNKQAIEDAAASNIADLVAGTNITIDKTDPQNPIINADDQTDPQVAINKGDIESLALSMLPFSFNGEMPDDQIIARFVAPITLILRASDPHHGYSPNGSQAAGNAVIQLYQLNTLIGTVEWTTESQEAVVNISSDVLFNAGDVLVLKTTVINAMLDPTITLMFQRQL